VGATTLKSMQAIQLDLAIAAKSKLIRFSPSLHRNIYVAFLANFKLSIIFKRLNIASSASIFTPAFDKFWSLSIFSLSGDNPR
jgi:hypothetical protein